MPIGDRIKEIRNAEHLTLAKFGEKIGIKSASLSTIENGKTSPSNQTIKSICREFNVSEAWLRDGTGEMYVPISRDTELEEFISRLLQEEPLSFRRRLVAALSRLTESDWEVFARFVTELAEAQPEPDPDSIDAQVEAYRRQLLEERAAQASQDSSRSSAAGDGVSESA